MFTSSQLRALNTVHHLSVTANAGSGKTMVLVERYIAVLLSGKASVNEVVAITFTDKAASELRRKISERVAAGIAESPEAMQKQKLEEIREQLSGAVIGTIHWFCAKILREYPVEAGVDAAFVVPELVDQRSILEAAVKDTFESILKEEPGAAKREELFDLLRALGKRKVIGSVHTLALKREQVERWTTRGIYSRSDDDVLAHWRSVLSDFVREEIASPRLMVDLQEILSTADGSGNSVFGFESRLRALRRTGSQEEGLDRYSELMEYVLTKKPSMSRKIISEQAETKVREQVQRIEQRHKALSPLIEFVRGKDDSTHRMLLKRARVLLDLYQNAMERYEQRKLEGAYLDFDDLQLRARNVLKREDVRKKLSHRFTFIMVDEYQDTNALQYEILLPLVNELQSGNLFIVGDPKQSIYGFRDADVGVFNRTKVDIAASAGEASAVVLNDSFRLLRDVAAFVNLVFAPLMQTDGDEVGYEPLVRGRQNDAPGRVEILLREKPDGEGDGEDVPESELIARRILQLRAQRYQVFDKNEKPYDVRFADFAVLLRSRMSLPELEEAFIHHNIPYLVSGGIGYFQTQGIYDFYNYFRFLLNTDDESALAGILRSPFFTVSDAELFEIAYERKGGLWNALTSAHGKTRKFSSLVRASEILKADLEVASRLSVPDLINRIVDQTSYAGFVEGSARVDQLLANLEKLKRIAQRYEQKGFTNLYDFVARLKRLIEEEEEEGQAAVDVLADAVKVMTIHAAKGLEFPVVILPALEQKFQLDHEPYNDTELGIGISSADEEENIPIVEFMKRKSYAKSRAEEKRVFYVACTRARDMLILSGAMPKNRSMFCFMNWLLNGLGESGAPKREFQITTQSLKTNHDEYARVNETHRLNVFVLRQHDLPRSLPFAVEERAGEEKQRLLIDPIPPKAKGEIFSASKIRTYIECPAKYYLRYVIGLPAANIRQASESVDDDSDVSIPAELRGQAFHRVMQHIDELQHDEKTIVRELRNFVQRDSLSILAEPMIELEKIAGSVLDVVRSAFWRDVQQAKDTRTEFTIMTSFGEDFLTGTLDRVYRDKDGVWHVLDYKTDAVSSSALQQKGALYEPQLAFYALLVRKFFSAPEVRTHLLFTHCVDEPVHFIYMQEHLERFERQLRESIAGIRRNEFPRPMMPCRDCPLAPEGCFGMS